MREDSVQKITAVYGSLSSSERTCADYIVTHLEEALHLSVQELAKRSGVSAAAPVRLAKRMGLEGYKELRLYLASHKAGNENLMVDINSCPDSVSKAVNRVLLSEAEAIKLTAEAMDYEKFKRIAEKLKSAERMLFFGKGSSHLVCMDASHKFQRIGKNAFCTDDEYKAAVQLSGFGENDVVICVTHSGETAVSCNILRLAQKLGIFSVCATTFSESSAGRLANETISTQTRESPLHTIAFTSRISQLATMDALFMTYYALDGDGCKKRLDRVSDTLDMLMKDA